MIFRLKMQGRGKRHRPSKTWRKTFVVLWAGRLDGDQYASLLVLGWFETRVSISQNGRIWRRAQ